MNFLNHSGYNLDIQSNITTLNFPFKQTVHFGLLIARIKIDRKFSAVKFIKLWHVSLTLAAFTDTISVLVIMGCACCKQKKSAKETAVTSATGDITDLSPSNPDGGLSTALTQGRYCPDPTQTIPDFNKGFSSSAIFPSPNTHQWTGSITSRIVCACMCVSKTLKWPYSITNLY